MIGPSRPMPRIGSPARVSHFGGEREDAIVIAVADDGRRLRVRTAAGHEQEFALSPATARFVSAENRHGPRLELL